jgi:ribulose-phosphate 3-epimerase
MKISASILAADTAFLGKEVLELEKLGIDFIHVDVIDGHYVNNFGFSPKTVKDLRRITDLPIEVHLEILNPENYVEIFSEAGADIIIVQFDTCSHPLRILRKIKALGKKAGVALSPCVSFESLRWCLNDVDYLLFMSVEPGFGGQNFETFTIDKIKLAKVQLKEMGFSIPIGVDGGVNLGNINLLREVGVDIVVVGSALFLNENKERFIFQIKGG